LLPSLSKDDEKATSSVSSRTTTRPCWNYCRTCCTHRNTQWCVPYVPGNDFSRIWSTVIDYEAHDKMAGFRWLTCVPTTVDCRKREPVSRFWNGRTSSES